LIKKWIYIIDWIEVYDLRPTYLHYYYYYYIITMFAAFDAK